MSIADDFIAELDSDLSATRQILARVPADKGAWKPHPRSSAFGHLAQLVARLPGVMAQIVEGIDLDLASGPPYTLEPAAVLLDEFDTNTQRVRRALQTAADGDFALDWRLLYGSEVVGNGRRKDVLRNTINHFVHHRAQLTVYLRMNEIPVPCLYGPTADERQ